MEWIQSINKAIDYIEDHLTEDIHCEDVAGAVYISVFHFQRTFNLLTGMTVGEYIRKRRLSLAGEELTRQNVKVIDVALKYSYDSPESFAKAFSRFHGITPGQVKKGNTLKSFNKLVVKITVERGTIMDYRIEKKESLNLLVCTKMFTDETSKTGIPAFWDEYQEKKMHEKVPGCIGACAQQKMGDTEFMYGIGCIVDSETVCVAGDKADRLKAEKGIPEGFRIINIPAHTWAIFKCVGSMPDAIQNMWDKIYSEWLPGADYELIPNYDIENYLPGDNAADDYISEIWIPIKAKA